MKKFFYRLVEWTQHHAWVVIGCVAVITVAMTWLALHVKPNPDMSTMTPEDPAVTRLTEKYGAANKGEDYLIVVARGPALFQPEALARFSAVLDQLSVLPHVHPGITPFNFPMFENPGRSAGFWNGGGGRRAPVHARGSGPASPEAPDQPPGAQPGDLPGRRLAGRLSAGGLLR